MCMPMPVARADSQSFQASVSMRRPHCLSFGRTALVAALAALVAVGALSVRHAGANELRLAGPAGRGMLESASAVRKLGFVTVTGTAINRTRADAAHIEAVVELLDNAGRTVQVDEAAVAFDPVAAGQSSPFAVQISDDTRAAAFRVRFRTFDGARID